MIDAAEHVGEESLKLEDFWDFVEEFKDTIEGFTESVVSSINNLSNNTITTEKILQDAGAVNLDVESDLIGSILKEQKKTNKNIKDISKKLNVPVEKAKEIYENDKEIKQYEKEISETLTNQEVFSEQAQDDINYIRQRFVDVKKQLDEGRITAGIGGAVDDKKPDPFEDNDDIQYIRKRIDDVNDMIDSSLGPQESNEELKVLDDIKENMEDETDRKDKENFESQLENSSEDRTFDVLIEFFEDIKEELKGISDSVKKTASGILDALLVLGQIAFLVWYYWDDLKPILSSLGQQISTSIRRSMPKWLGGGAKVQDYVDDQGNIKEDMLQRDLASGEIDKEVEQKARTLSKQTQRFEPNIEKEKNEELKGVLQQISYGVKGGTAIGDMSKDKMDSLQTADPEKFKEYTEKQKIYEKELTKEYTDKLEGSGLFGGIPYGDTSKAYEKARKDAAREAFNETYLNIKPDIQKKDIEEKPALEIIKDKGAQDLSHIQILEDLHPSVMGITNAENVANAQSQAQENKDTPDKSNSSPVVLRGGDTFNKNTNVTQRTPEKPRNNDAAKVSGLIT